MFQRGDVIGGVSDTVGSCSGNINILTTDAYGNPSGPVADNAVDTVIGITTASKAIFFTDSTCTTPATNYTIGAGRNRSSVYLMDSTYEPIPVRLRTVSGPLKVGTPSPVLYLAPTANVYLVTSGPVFTKKDSCTPFEVKLTGFSAGAPILVNLFAGITNTHTDLQSIFVGFSSSLTVYSDSNCSTPITSATIPGSTDTFYTRASAPFPIVANLQIYARDAVGGILPLPMLSIPILW